MQFKNVRYFGEDFKFHYGDVTAENGIITEIIESKQEEGGGDMLLPGFVDIHIHGNSGFDFSDGEYDEFVAMSRFLANAGTTSFSLTSMTVPEHVLNKAYKTAASLRDSVPEGCAAIRGITMEGPFFSEAKKGAQPAEHLRLPDIDMFRRLQSAADGMIRIVCVAPEIEGAKEFIREAKVSGVIVAAAHTNADYKEASAGFDAGISHLTHLFNAMPSLLHRDPGIIGASAERADITVELICDGQHVHPSAIRAAFKLFGPERICIISDATAATGAKSGNCTLGGKKVFVKDGRAVLEDGTIAGSIATLFECVKNAVAFGIPAEHAVRCASYNPARVIGANNIGVIAVGKRADVLLCGADWTLKDVYIAGNKLERTQDK